MSDPSTNGTDDEPLTLNSDFGAGIRTGLAAALGQAGFEDRDEYDTFGWPEDPEEDFYLALYLRNAYARTVVDKPALTSWRNSPDVHDEADRDETTEFEQRLDALVRKHSLWGYGTRIDRLAGIGEHGIVVLGFSDTEDMADFRKPVDDDAFDSADALQAIRVYQQSQVDDVDYGGPGDGERWGKPVNYTIDPQEDIDEEAENEGSFVVHHSRVIDVPATRLLDDETRSRPRVEPVLNNILDIRKTLGATAELAYRGADYGLHANADPEKVDTSNLGSLDEELSDYIHGLQPFIRTTGVDVETLGGEVADPTGIIENNIDAIAAQTGIPKKELRGNDSGEVSGAEADQESWFRVVGERREQYVTPHIVRPLVQRLVDKGVLPEPSGEGFRVSWPDLHELSEAEQAEIEQQRSAVVSNLGMVPTALTGDAADRYIETGEFPAREEQAANETIDESDPRVTETFDALVGNADVSAGDAVTTPDGDGVVTDVLDEGVEFDGEQADRGAVVVALADGGFGFFEQSEVESSDWFDEEDVAPEELAGSTTANVYDAAVSANVALHEKAFVEYCRANEDPEVGFRTLPDGWTRKSVLQAWASLGGTFTTCRADMVGEIRSPNRFCAALKDEVLGTEEWRGKF